MCYPPYRMKTESEKILLKHEEAIEKGRREIYKYNNFHEKHCDCCLHPDNSDTGTRYSNSGIR